MSRAHSAQWGLWVSPLRAFGPPLAGPGLAATAIFTLLNAWDEFFFALIFTSTYAAKTVPVVLAEFIGRHSVN